MKLALVTALLLGLAGVARADLAVQARGSATISGGDVAAAKARALDDALRQAVDQAAGGMVTPEQRASAADLIKKRILRKARSYVLRYKVAAEGEADGVYSITVDATLADGLLGADVRALVAGPPSTPPVTPVSRPGRPPLVLLCVTRAGDQTWATFGRGAGDGGPVAPSLERELTSRGFKIAPSAGLEVPVASEGEEGLPLASAQSVAIAKAAGAGGAVVAGVVVKDGGRIRGTRRVGAEVAARFRLDDAGGDMLAEGQVSAAGSGADLGAAAADAGREVAAQAGRLLGKRLESHWPPSEGPASADGILVKLRGLARGADVELFSRALAGGAGVKAVLVSRLGRHEVTLLVRGPSLGGGQARALAGLTAAVAVPGSRVQARASGDGEVEVDVAVDPLRLPPAPAAVEATP